MIETILAIETSCDETAVSVVDEEKNILFDTTFSQDHVKYNGVYPEIAAREHLKTLPLLVKDALCAVDVQKLTAIAVTSGPGLIGSLIVGTMMARGLAFSLKKQLISINHLEGHALSVRLTENVEFPFLLLLVSGGHSKIILVKSPGVYQTLGGTIDDAFGEAFDKVAVMLGLKYPGGVEVEKKAKFGDKNRFAFPRAIIDASNCDFSLSGIKTSVKNQIRKIQVFCEQDICDICASFQECISEIIIKKLANAYYISKCKNIVAAGGVASNFYIRTKIKEFALAYGLDVFFPPPKICTDNAAMIAWAAIERINNGLPLHFVEPRPRWPL